MTANEALISLPPHVARTGAEHLPLLRVDDVLDNQFTITERIRVRPDTPADVYGGQTKDGSPVVVKVLLEEGQAITHQGDQEIVGSQLFSGLPGFKNHVHSGIARVGRDPRRIIVEERASEGSLLQYVLEHGGGVQRSLSVAKQIMPAVVALEAKGVVWGDPKLSNIVVDMVDGEERYSLIDLGSTKFEDDGEAAGITESLGGIPSSDVPVEELTAAAYGTNGYVAKEIEQAEDHGYEYMTTASDMYALGLTMLNIVHGVHDAHEAPTLPSNLEQLDAQKHQQLLHLLAYVKRTLPEYGLFLEACIDTNPRNRPTPQAAEHRLRLL